jgi:hypothetical protein
MAGMSKSPTAMHTAGDTHDTANNSWSRCVVSWEDTSTLQRGVLAACALASPKIRAPRQQQTSLRVAADRGESFL